MDDWKDNLLRVFFAIVIFCFIALGLGWFDKKDPQTIDSQVEEVEPIIASPDIGHFTYEEGLGFTGGDLKFNPVPMPPFKVQFDPFIMLLPFEVDFQDKETGRFLGKFEIRNVKNKRVQVFWNGYATSVFFPVGKEK